MHTKLRLMALGMVLLGGGTSMAEAEEGPECQPTTIQVENCPAEPFGWGICANLQPTCAVEDWECDAYLERLTCYYFRW